MCMHAADLHKGKGSLPADGARLCPSASAAALPLSSLSSWTLCNSQTWSFTWHTAPHEKDTSIAAAGILVIYFSIALKLTAQTLKPEYIFNRINWKTKQAPLPTTYPNILEVKKNPIYKDNINFNCGHTSWQVLQHTVETTTCISCFPCYTNELH